MNDNALMCTDEEVAANNLAALVADVAVHFWETSYLRGYAGGELRLIRHVAEAISSSFRGDASVVAAKLVGAIKHALDGKYDQWYTIRDLALAEINKMGGA